MDVICVNSCEMIEGIEVCVCMLRNDDEFFCLFI